MEWISVNDRLPSLDGIYMVFLKGGIIRCSYYNGKFWKDENDNNINCKILEWSGFPEPYWDFSEDFINDDLM